MAFVTITPTLASSAFHFIIQTTELLKTIGEDFALNQPHSPRGLLQKTPFM